MFYLTYSRTSYNLLIIVNVIFRVDSKHINGLGAYHGICTASTKANDREEPNNQILGYTGTWEY